MLKIMNSCKLVVYRSASSNEALLHDEFTSYLESLDVVGSEVIVCGDFNFLGR